ncbi:MAG: hypothetical protein HLUCCO16_12340 [Phormidium sp. OSCR]|nr:MAG: hypothetical protein HLUCCO16_12340 [Phormidium sp. OSCR]
MEITDRSLLGFGWGQEWGQKPGVLKTLGFECWGGVSRF